MKTVVFAFLMTLTGVQAAQAQAKISEECFKAISAIYYPSESAGVMRQLMEQSLAGIQQEETLSVEQRQIQIDSAEHLIQSAKAMATEKLREAFKVCK